MRAFFLIILALASSSALAERGADTKQFSYLVRVPATTLSCAQEAELLAERFAGATQLADAKGTCREVLNVVFDKTPYTLYSLMVTYRAQKAVYPYSAIFGETTLSGEPGASVGGLFANYQECLNALPGYIGQFEFHTQLPAVSGFCQAATYGLPFTLQIDSFGIPAKKLFAHYPKYSTEPDVRALIPELATRMGGQGVISVRANTFYYAPRLLTIQEQSFGLMGSPANCTTQLEEAHRIMSNAGNSVIFTLCAGNGSNMQALGDSAALILNDLGMSGMLYYSFSECMNDKERVINQQISQGQRVLGALCRPDYSNRDYFRVEIYKSI